ncbi:MAG: hypothetical protein LBD02_07170 [Christensenellaceae bacterium]|nr:hypothetical protein [Christensenellaceae bacterium]
MKSASAILKLPIVAVSEGEQVAQVKNVLISRRLKKASFLHVAHGIPGIFPELIAYSDILSVGNDFIVIRSAGDIKKVFDNKALVDAAADGVFLQGTIALSGTGDILGKVADFDLDEKSGAIEALLLENGDTIPGSRLVTLSPGFVLTSVGAAEEEGESQLDEGSMNFLLGKTLTQDVASQDGGFRIARGTQLSRELILQAERHDLLPLLTLAV